MLYPAMLLMPATFPRISELRTTHGTTGSRQQRSITNAVAPSPSTRFIGPRPGVAHRRSRHLTLVLTCRRFSAEVDIPPTPASSSVHRSGKPAPVIGARVTISEFAPNSLSELRNPRSWQQDLLCCSGQTAAQAGTFPGLLGNPVVRPLLRAEYEIRRRSPCG